MAANPQPVDRLEIKKGPSYKFRIPAGLWPAPRFPPLLFLREKDSEYSLWSFPNLK